MITMNTPVEDILGKFPGIIKYFIKNGVSPFSCAGAYPSSIGKLLEVKKVDRPEEFIEQLNIYIKENY